MTVAAADERTRIGWLLAGLAVGVAVTAVVVLLAVRVIGGGPPPDAAPAPSLSLAGDTGIDQVYNGAFHYFVGGGVAPFDCNGDGFPDIYLPGGSSTAALYVNESTPGDVRFSRLADPVTDLESVTGAYPIDIDSDSITDLVVLRVGENVVLRGLGSCHFERANEDWGIDGGNYWTAAFSATWEQGQTFPTLAFGNYLRLAENGSHDQCEDHQLLRPDGQAYLPPTDLSPGWCTLSVLFSDWDRTGERDLRATNDRHYYRDGEEQLWRVAPGQPPTLYTAADGWQPMQIWGMGIATQDLTGDGYPEVFLTSQGDNKLQTLTDGADEPAYRDIALALGATAHRPFAGDTTLPSTAWHAEFDDVNNDGYMDLLVTKGNVDEQVGFAMEDPNNLLLGQPNGTFVEGAQAAGFVDYSRSRGAALTDLDLDGALDAVVVERREPVTVWHNSGVLADGSPTGSWLAVRLAQPAPNVDAIGSWVEVRSHGATTEREVTIGGGHAGGELGWIHFGLGDADAAELRVTWSDGSMTSWLPIEADTFLLVDKATGTAETWSPLQD
ncbi:MAG: CRTAC1 family protein [Acidimicrobiia bacterium]